MPLTCVQVFKLNDQRVQFNVYHKVMTVKFDFGCLQVIRDVLEGRTRPGGEVKMRKKGNELTPVNPTDNTAEAACSNVPRHSLWRDLDGEQESNAKGSNWTAENSRQVKGICTTLPAY